MAKDLYNFLEKYSNKKKEFKELKYIDTKVHGRIKVNQKNLKLYLEYIDYKEDLLRKKYGSDEEAKIRQNKTLYKELTTYGSNVLYWFNDIDFTKADKKDFEEIYSKIEGNNLPTVKGKYKLSPASKKDYYSRVFKGGFFKFIGKSDITKEIFLRVFRDKEEVRFFDIATLRKIADHAVTPDHRLLYWLMFDTGVEVSALCQIKAKNFEIDDEGEIKYVINIDIAKGTRQKRVEYLMLTETKTYLKQKLEGLKPDQFLFNFKPGAVYAALKKITRKYNFKTQGETNEFIIPKDFRSSCACHMIKQDDTTIIDIKARLGHSITSTMLEKYTNYMARDKKKILKKKKQVDLQEYQDTINRLQENMTVLKRRFNKKDQELTKVVDATKNVLAVQHRILKDHQILLEKIFKANMPKDEYKKAKSMLKELQVQSMLKELDVK